MHTHLTPAAVLACTLLGGLPSLTGGPVSPAQSAAPKVVTVKGGAR